MKAKATELYAKMTNYDTFVIIFLWCDVTKILSISSGPKAPNLRCWCPLIKLLYIRLRENYPIDSEMPKKLALPDGYGAHVMQQFWGKDYYVGMFLTFNSNMLTCI